MACVFAEPSNLPAVPRVQSSAVLGPGFDRAFAKADILIWDQQVEIKLAFRAEAIAGWAGSVW